MEEPKRYSCGNGEGMFDNKKGYWITYEEHKNIINELKEAIDYAHSCTRFTEKEKQDLATELKLRIHKVSTYNADEDGYNGYIKYLNKLVEKIEKQP